MQCTAKAAICRILIVGDRRPLAGVLEKCELHSGWETDLAADGCEAAVTLSKNRYDVVLVALRADESGELPTVKTLRAADPDVKIILFVEDATTAQIVAAIRAHAFSYFSAPFDADSAYHMIATAAALSDWSNGIQVLSAAPEYLTLRLRCALHTAHRLVQFLKELQVELPPGEQEETAQAFYELLLNAIEHGGKLNPDEWVRVSRIRTQRTLVYHIVDPGEGFSRADLAHAAISNPDDPMAHVQARADLGRRPGGFGMLIATQMVDEVIYNEQGNQVILIRHLK